MTEGTRQLNEVATVLVASRSTDAHPESLIKGEGRLWPNVFEVDIDSERQLIEVLRAGAAGGYRHGRQLRSIVVGVVDQPGLRCDRRREDIR